MNMELLLFIIEKHSETNVENCYIAGVIAAGNDANTIFIENGKYHGGVITQSILTKTNTS